jgi:hypothetical protein
MRSISPFSKKNVTVNDPGPSVPLTNDYPTTSTPLNTTTKPTWSVEGINFLQFLQIFYERYNPEKLSSIDFIYKEYQGEEMILIYELAEKYNLSHEAMQKILNTTKTTLPGSGQLQVDTMAALSKHGPPSSSSQGSGTHNTTHSVIAPNWQTRRTTERSSSTRNVSPYLSSSSAKQDRQQQHHQEQQPMGEPQPQRDETQTTTRSSAAPMSLQDIIQTTRQNDLLAKKSVRFSMTDPDAEQDLASEGNSSQSASLPSPSPASGVLLSTKRVSNFGSNQIQQHLQPTPSSTPTLSNHPPLRTNASYPSLQNPSPSGASSLQARIRSSLGATGGGGQDSEYPSQQFLSSSSPRSIQSDQQSDQSLRYSDTSNGNDSSSGGGVSYPRGFGRVKAIEQHSSNDTDAAISSAAATAVAVARVTELEEELKTTQLHLHEVRNEREDLLKIFEDSWGSPQQILKVVASYLERHGRTVDLQTDDGQSSIRSSFSNNPTMQMEDLEGRKAYRVSHLL